MLNAAKNFVVSYKKELFIAILLFLVSTTSFGLGYLTAREFNRTPIIIEKNSGN